MIESARRQAIDVLLDQRLFVLDSERYDAFHARARQSPRAGTETAAAAAPSSGMGIGIGAVLVHAKDDASTRFYMKCAEFIEYPTDSRTLFLSIETVVAAFSGDHDPGGQW